MRTLYDKLPELSVEPCHDRLTLVVVIAVTTRLLGAVGADRSPLPPAAELVDPLKSSAAVKARIVIPMIRRERCRVVMDLLLLTKGPFQITVTRVQGLHPHQRTHRSDTHAG